MMFKKFFKGFAIVSGVVFLGLVSLVAVAAFGGASDWDWTWNDPAADVNWIGNYNSVYQISAEPQIALATEAVAIQVTGFEPNQQVAIRASANDKDGVLWQSTAIFQADANGMVDVTTQAPMTGSYSGVDPMGLFWSMRPTVQKERNIFSGGDGAYQVEISAEAAGKPLTTTMLTRLRHSPDLIREDVRTPMVIGTLITPPSSEPLPTILIIGGSEGGLPEKSAERWASHGYAAFALGYHKVEGRPSLLSEVPLEYFDAALSWLRTHPSVDPGNIVIHATSRGTEAGFLTAINNPDVAAVIAVVPSSMVWTGLDFSRMSETRGKVPSAWTRNGVALPANSFTFSVETIRTIMGKPGRLGVTYAHGAENPEPNTLIPIEQIQAPILLISGTDDQLWPSSTFADQIVSRLTTHNFAYDVEHLRLDGAGHTVLPEWQPPVYISGSAVMGGSREANGSSTGPFWQTQLTFIDEHVGR